MHRSKWIKLSFLYILQATLNNHKILETGGDILSDYSFGTLVRIFVKHINLISSQSWHNHLFCSQKKKMFVLQKNILTFFIGPTYVRMHAIFCVSHNQLSIQQLFYFSGVGFTHQVRTLSFFLFLLKIDRLKI